MQILNLTQHPATPEQLEAGVVDLIGESLEHMKALLTFHEIPSWLEMRERASELVMIARDGGFEAAMLGGAPFFMPMLHEMCHIESVKPLYAFSKRESVETVMEDGSTRKTNVFRHVGFV